MREEQTRTGQIEIVGEVTSGRGRAIRELAALANGIFAVVKQPLHPGSLNVLLKQPLHLREAAANFFGDDRRMLWPASLDGVPVWIYRWPSCPLHILELVSTISLRERFHLHDGDSVVLSLAPEHVGVVRPSERIGWAALWAGRRRWHYSKNKYSGMCTMLGIVYHYPVRGSLMIFKGMIRRMPVVGDVATWAARKVRIPSYRFSRMETDGCAQEHDLLARQIQNILNFAKTSESMYAARQFPAGYHSLHINGLRLRGQRDPYQRLAQVPFEFRGKTVLDLGCNQGGMIHALASRVKWAVGVDFDSRMINAANRIKEAIGSENTHFYVLDLEKDPLELISDFMPDQRADICFLLSVCMWLKNWQEVIDFAQAKSSSMLFETNGTPSQQQGQIAYLRRKYANVDVLLENSEDDPNQKNRKLLFLSEPICVPRELRARTSQLSNPAAPQPEAAQP